MCLRVKQDVMESDGSATPEQVESELRLNGGRTKPARTSQSLSSLRVMSKGELGSDKGVGPGDIGLFCYRSRSLVYSEVGMRRLGFIFF